MMTSKRWSCVLQSLVVLTLTSVPSTFAAFAPPSGGVWLFGVKAFSPIDTVFAFAVNLTYPSGSTVLSETEIPLHFNSSLAPNTRDWAQDNVNGRLVMWHSVAGHVTCALETIQISSSGHAPTLVSTWVVPQRFCVSGAKVILNPHMSSSVFVLAYIDGLKHPTLLRIVGGGGSGVRAATVSIVSSRIPDHVSTLCAAINPVDINLYIVNTSLLSQNQNVVRVSIISGDVDAYTTPIDRGGVARFSAIQFNPHTPGFNPHTPAQLWATANYNSNGIGGVMASVDTSSAAWRATKLTSTNRAFGTYVFDFKHETAFAGGPSGANVFDVHHGNPQVGVIAVKGSWNYGTVFPFTQ